MTGQGGKKEEDKDIISKVIDVCDDIMGGRSDDIPFSLFGQSGYIAKAVGENNVRLDGGSGNIVYNGGRILTSCMAIRSPLSSSF